MCCKRNPSHLVLFPFLPVGQWKKQKARQIRGDTGRKALLGLNSELSLDRASALRFPHETHIIRFDLTCGKVPTIPSFFLNVLLWGKKLLFFLWHLPNLSYTSYCWKQLRWTSEGRYVQCIGLIYLMHMSLKCHISSDLCSQNICFSLTDKI